MLTDDQLDIFSIAVCIALIASGVVALILFMRRNRLTMSLARPLLPRAVLCLRALEDACPRPLAAP